MVADAPLYETITNIAEDYFGPAAPRFMHRLITSHLGKEPEQIKPNDIAELTDWVRSTLAVITDDKQQVDEFIKRLKAAAK